MKSNNQIIVPNAKEAMDKFKMQAANEVGVNLKEGYNGDLTSREAGSVGGQMVKKMCPVRTTTLHRNDRVSVGYQIAVTYDAELGL